MADGTAGITLPALNSILTTGSPDELAAHLRSELAKWSKVVKDSKITAE
jgi:tripartite-type tricarboxylate transporter receptor subunit TctC